MEKAVEKTEENRERKSAEQGPEDLYAFLLPYAEEEIRTIRAQTGVPMREAAVLGKGLLFQRLKDLAEPTVQAMLEENLCSINPAVTLSPHFASEADRERALRETAAQLRRPEGNPFASGRWGRFCPSAPPAPIRICTGSVPCESGPKAVYSITNRATAA